MASACVNKILDFPSPPPSSSSSWLSPRISFSRDLLEQESSTTNIAPPPSENPPSNHSGFLKRDPDGDFEFPLEEDPVMMLPADQLFSDGKLVPLQIHCTVSDSTSSKSNTTNNEMLESIITNQLHRQDSPSFPSSSSTAAAAAAADLYLFSPKAPRCSSRWRELLGLKRQQQQNKQDQQQKKNPNPNSSSSSTSRSLKYFLHRNSNNNNNNKSDSLPLLKDIDSSSAADSIISRLSLSSSSSSSSSSGGEDPPRISLDSENNNNKFSNLNNNRNQHRNLPSMKVKLDNKKSATTTSRSSSTSGRSGCHPTTVRVGRTSVRSASSIPSSRGVSVDSPRMNSSGKIVFQSLERSSSSPSSFNGGPPASNRLKSRGIGMERSYSANVVRVSPVLNVPVCSLKSGSVFGFGQLFSSPQKRDGGSTSTRTHTKKNHHHRTTTGIGGGGGGSGNGNGGGGGG